MLAMVLLVTATGLAGAQEPPRLDGTWAGTWWMGKYGKAIEMELAQRGTTLTGRVGMVGYPGTQGPTDAPVTGELEGDQVRLVWPVGGGQSFMATLRLTGPGTLAGLGGESGQVTAGLELNRLR
jgi:hypothetical protein